MGGGAGAMLTVAVRQINIMSFFSNQFDHVHARLQANKAKMDTRQFFGGNWLTSLGKGTGFEGDGKSGLKNMFPALKPRNQKRAAFLKDLLTEVKRTRQSNKMMSQLARRSSLTLDGAGPGTGNLGGNLERTTVIDKLVDQLMEVGKGNVANFLLNEEAKEPLEKSLVKVLGKLTSVADLRTSGTAGADLRSSTQSDTEGAARRSPIRQSVARVKSDRDSVQSYGRISEAHSTGRISGEGPGGGAMLGRRSRRRSSSEGFLPPPEGL